jgi:hypothetical protein
MKFTDKQLKDLETIEYFIPSALKHIKITDEDKKMFFENSERGLHNDIIKKIKPLRFYPLNTLIGIRDGGNWKTVPYSHEEKSGWIMEESGMTPEEVISYYGFLTLVEGKRWRGIHIHELYEPGVLEGTMPYYTILGGDDGDIVPRSVVDFLKKEMFKGADADVIERCYQDILNNKAI